MKDRKALARQIAARTSFIEIKLERRKRGFTREELHRLRYGLDWAEVEFERRVRTRTYAPRSLVAGVVHPLHHITAQHGRRH